MSNQTTDLFPVLFQHSRVNAFIRMDIGGYITAVNPAFTNYFGYTTDEVQGKHFSLFFTVEDRAARRPEIELEKVRRTGQCDDKNFFVHKDGRITWVSGESVRIPDENGGLSLVKMIQDIQLEKDVQISLTRASDLNETILNTIDDIVILLDKTLHVAKYNPAFARLFGLTQLERDIDFATLIKPFDTQNELYHKIVQVINKGIHFSKHVIEISAQGDKRIFDIRCQPVADKDRDLVILLVGHDITTQHKAEIEREDLMGFVAHELRNPLTSIKLGNDIMEALLRNGTSSGLESLLEKNRKNIERLNQLVAELYDAAKIGGGNFILTLAPYDFDDMVQEAVDSFRLGQTFHQFTVSGKAMVTLQGDRYRMVQVLSNLLSNAVKYASRQPEVLIHVERQANSITVSVTDHGAGISQEHLPYIFDRFFRAEKTRNLEGIGLGLFLCRRIIQAHGGRIWAESEEGKGSVFFFSLPI